MNRHFGKPVHEMTNYEAMDHAPEHSAMEALGQFSATNLIDDFDGSDILELRRQLEIAIRVCVREAIRARRCLEQITRARAMCDVMNQHGIATEWNGDPCTRIKIVP